MFSNGNIQSRPIPELFRRGGLDPRTWNQRASLLVGLEHSILRNPVSYSLYGNNFDALDFANGDAIVTIPAITISAGDDFSISAKVYHTAYDDNGDGLFGDGPNGGFWVGPSGVGLGFRDDAGAFSAITLSSKLPTNNVYGLKITKNESGHFAVFINGILSSIFTPVDVRDFTISKFGESQSRELSMTMFDVEISINGVRRFWPGRGCTNEAWIETETGDNGTIVGTANCIPFNTSPEAPDLCSAQATLIEASYESPLYDSSSAPVDDVKARTELTEASYDLVVFNSSAASNEGASIRPSLVDADYFERIFNGAATTPNSTNLNTSLTQASYELA